MPGTPALGWEMQAPSTSGGKAYLILVVDNMMVTGWGSLSSDSRQYAVKRYRTPALAQTAAHEQTAAKEAKGYMLTSPPSTVSITPNNLAMIKSHTRGSSNTLDHIFRPLL